jgi:hypothetical protein
MAPDEAQAICSNYCRREGLPKGFTDEQAIYELETALKRVRRNLGRQELAERMDLCKNLRDISSLDLWSA